jgi:hypothetical protein
LLELDGVDYRPLPLGKRKERLARLVDRRLVGIVMNDHTDARGELVFQQACRMGLEGIVSKRLSKPYQSGPSRTGSRSRTRTAPPWCAIGRGTGRIEPITRHGDPAAPPLSATMARQKCHGIIGADARPNWQEQPPRETLTGVQWR